MVTEVKRSKYRLLGLIGQGQFGRVFCATHRTTGRLVALKNLDHQRFPTHKFLRELRFLLSLQHTNIVSCQALEHSRSGRYLVMDYCEGGTLRGLMESESGLTMGQALKLITDLLAGLEHAHNREIVHCDIKPENILLSVQPTGWVARISDFGIAKLSQELADESGDGNTGSPAYMAPERFYGQYSRSSDLYAVGVMLFELLVGDRPFSGTPQALMSAHLNQPVKIPPEIPNRLQPIILTALQKLPARRYHTAADMLKALQAAIASPDLIPLLDTRLPNPYADLEAGPPPVCSAANLPAQALIAPIIYMATAPSAPLYQATLTGTGCQLIAGEIRTDSGAARFVATAISHEISDLIQDLIARPKGCLVIARRAIYWWAYPTPAPDGRVTMSAAKLVAHFDSDFIATLDPQGRWIATGAIDPQSGANELTCWKLPQDLQAIAPLHPTTAPALCQSKPPLQLFALDSRHLVLLSTLANPEHHERPDLRNLTFVEQGNRSHSQGTLVEVLTRRGNRIGSWNLPVPIQQAVLGAQEYRLIATEYFNPTSVLIIDLKPLRMMRLDVGICPLFLLAASWGYILVDQVGKVVVLDDLGRQVGCIEGFQDAVLLPSTSRRNHRVTAATLYNQHILLLSTWNGVQHRGNFYAVDLRTLEIDLVF